MSQSFIKQPAQGSHSALAGLGVLSTERAPADPLDVLRRIVAWRDSVHAGRVVRSADLEALIQEARTLTLGVPVPQKAQSNVPPGKWKVDMPDGLYTEMPGAPPGPCDLCKVIGGYVYFVTPRSGKLVAVNPPRTLGVKAEGDGHA